MAACRDPVILHFLGSHVAIASKAYELSILPLAVGVLPLKWISRAEKVDIEGILVDDLAHRIRMHGSGFPRTGAPDCSPSSRARGRCCARRAAWAYQNNFQWVCILRVDVGGALILRVDVGGAPILRVDVGAALILKANVGGLIVLKLDCRDTCTQGGLILALRSAFINDARSDRNVMQELGGQHSVVDVDLRTVREPVHNEGLWFGSSNHGDGEIADKRV